MYLSPALAKPDGEIRIWEELPKLQLSNDWYLFKFSCSVRSDSLWAYGPQYTREAWSFPVLHHLPDYSQTHVHWVMRPSNHLVLCHPLLLLPLIFPRIRVFSNESALHMYQVTKVLELQLQHQSFKWIFRVDLLQDWMVWSTCSPKDSQESSPPPQFESIKLDLLYGPTLTSIHDYWKNHSFDYTDLCWQSNVSPF